MKTIGIKPAFIVAALAMPILALNATADTVTYTGNIAASMLSGTSATTLNLFDPSLGTLTGVTLTLDFTLTPVATLFNPTFTSQTFTPSQVVFHSYNAADTMTLSLGADSWNIAGPVVTTGNIAGTGQVLPSFTLLNFVGSTSAPADFTSETGTDLPSYQGVGTLTFGTSAAGQSGATGPFAGGGTADLSGTGSVTYTFTPVPEPSTFALLGLGGIAAMALRKRQAKS